jgi:hypothetical protein
MTHHEFHHLLSGINALSPEQMRQLRRELDRKLAAPSRARAKKAAVPSEVTVFDLIEKAGLIGCIKGLPRTATGLSTNAKHMEGFGRG